MSFFAQDCLFLSYYLPYSLHNQQVIQRIKVDLNVGQLTYAFR